QARMAQLAVHRPLDERHLHDDLRPHPVGADAGQARAAGERRRRNLERVEPRAQIAQQFRVEAGADPSGEHEILTIARRLALRTPRVSRRGEIADEQRAEADARTLRIGEAANDELLAGFDLHLEPVRRAAMLVARPASLRDDAFPAFGAGPL